MAVPSSWLPQNAATAHAVPVGGPNSLARILQGPPLVHGHARGKAAWMQEAARGGELA